MNSKTASRFHTAIVEGILKSRDQWVEPPAQDTRPGNDHDALNRVFHEVGAEIIALSKQTVKIGHEMDPKLGGHIDLAEKTKQAGKFQLVLIHMQDEARRIPVGILQTSEKGFPVSLTWPRANQYDHDTVTTYSDEQLTIAIKAMVSELNFGSALTALMEHTLPDDEKIVIH